MVKILLVFWMFSFASFSQMNSCKNDFPKNDLIIENNADKNPNEKFLTISELNEQKPSEGIFETRGFVVKIYTCPPCPPDAICKPCMGDNIVISEENKSLDSYELTKKELIIFTDKAETFIKGKAYKFKIEITDGKKTSAKLNDVKLISSELIKN